LATHDSTEYLDWSKAERVALRGFLKVMKTGEIREKRDRY